MAKGMPFMKNGAPPFVKGEGGEGAPPFGKKKKKKKRKKKKGNPGQVAGMLASRFPKGGATY